MKVTWSVLTVAAFLYAGAAARADSDGRHWLESGAHYWRAIDEVAAFLAASANSDGRHRLGGGVHYWRTIDEIGAAGFDVDKDGIGWMISYQYVPSLFKLELDVGLLPDDFAGIKETTLAPQALLLIGAGIYGGLGVGTFVTESDFADDPFFIVRAGVEIEFLPSIYLDINANYHFSDFDSISNLDKNVDTDTLTLGAMIRFDL